MDRETKYDDPNRFAPKASLKPGETSIIKGYQNFEISPYHIEVNREDENLLAKKSLVTFILDSEWIVGKSVLDLGGNAGFFALAALLKGAESATCVDLDNDYTSIAKKLKSHLSLQSFQVEEKLVSECDKPADLVFSFALIHWIYSCTETYGSLSDTIAKLASLTNEILVVEWIDPKDKAIREFGHLDFNSSIHKEEYSNKKFEEALKQHFNSFEILGETRSTRKVYVAYKNADTPEELQHSPLNFSFTDIFINFNEAGLEYRVLKNASIISRQIDEYHDRHIDICVFGEHFPIFSAYLTDISDTVHRDESVEYHKIGTGQKGSYVIMKLINASTDYLPKVFTDNLWEKTEKRLGLKVISEQQEIDYIAFCSAYLLGGSENAWNTRLNDLLEKNPNHTLSITGTELTNVGSIHKYLISNNLGTEDSDLRLLEYSMPYIEPGIDNVIHSRYLDFSTARPYISRLYKNGEIIIKQANGSLAENEYSILKRLNSINKENRCFFPEVSDLKKVDTFASFEMPYLPGISLSSAIDSGLNNNDIDYIKKQLNIIYDILNEESIEHRDINPDNILVLPNYNIVLIDFGWAIKRGDKSFTPNGLNPDYHPTEGHSDKFSIEKIIELLDSIQVDEIPQASNKRNNLEELSKLSALLDELSGYTDGDSISASGILYRLAEECYRLGKYRDASEYIEEELIINPDNDKALHLLSDIENQREKENISQSELPEDDIDFSDFSGFEKLGQKLMDRSEEEFISVDSRGFKYDVSIIIPVFNNPELTGKTLESIFASASLVRYEVIVIDNGSESDTKRVLKSFSSRENFTVYTNKDNLGFAKAVNLGISERKGRHALLLNNDIIVYGGWLQKLTAALKDSIGIVGGLLLYPGSQIVQHAGVNIGTEDGYSIAPYHVDQFADLSKTPDLISSREVDAVTGAMMLISFDCIEKVGVLDESYINGLEDIDYCIRARKHGFGIYLESDAVAYHYESMSKGRHDNDIYNWQLLNKKWIPAQVINEAQQSTLENVESIRSNKERIEKKRLSNSGLSQTGTEPQIQPLPEEEDIELSIIILTHNNIDYTITCLESLFRTLTVTAEVIVADNASEDDTLMYLENLGQRITLIKNRQNFSFSKANNIAAKKAKGKYLLFLNNDVELLPGWCDFLVSHFENNPGTGVQGAKLLYPNGKIQHAGIVYGKVSETVDMHYHIYLTKNRNAPEVNQTRQFQMVTGAMLAIRRELFEEVEGFDEEYIFGYEDLDLCLKAGQNGAKTIYNHEVEAYHHESITKKSEGLQRFESFIINPEGLDAENNRIFQSKWKDILKADADKYYEEDGFYGLVSNKSISEQYTARLNEFVSNANIIINKKGVQFRKKLAEILFGDAGVDFISKPQYLLRTSVFDLKQAEKEIGISTDYIREKTSTPQSLPRVMFTMYGWEDSGGGTILPNQIAKKLVAEGFEVAVFYADTDNHTESGKAELIYNTQNGVDLYAVKGRKILFTDSNDPLSEIEDKAVVQLFEDAINSFKPDIVHFHNFVGLSFALSDITKLHGITTFYTPHNYHLIDPTLYMINNDLKSWKGTDIFRNTTIPIERHSDYKKRVIKAKDLLRDNIDYTLAVSSRQKDILSEFMGYGPELYVVNQISDLVNRSPRLQKETDVNEPLKIGYVGSVIPHKGVHLLAMAAEKFQHGDLELHIFGEASGEYEKFLKQISTKNNIYFHGKYDSLNHVADLVDVVAFTSIWEDCAPLVIAEVLSLGLPCVAPSIGGFSDFILNGVNGLIYDAGSPESLAESIDLLYSDRYKISELSKNCFLPYGFDEFVSHVAGLYQKAFYGISVIEGEITLSFREHLQKTVPGKPYSKTTGITSRTSSKGSQNKYPKHGFSTKRATGRLPETLPEIVRLNLGCGLDVRDGFINIDLYSDDPRVVGMDIRHIDLPDSTADQIIASDIIEHFPHREINDILREWNRVLKPSGVLIIRCPNLRLQLQAYMRGDWDADIASYMIFGGQTNPGDYHYIAFDHNSIEKHLKETGFEIDSIRDEDYPQNKGYINLNMVVRAKKVIKDSQNLSENDPLSTKKDTDHGFSPSDSAENPETQDVTSIANIKKAIQSNIDVPVPSNPLINLVWEGTQMVYHSLALVNREIANELIGLDEIDISLVPYEKDKIHPLTNEKFARIFSKDIRVKDDNPAAKGKPFLWVRHQWPPQPEPPRGSKWIIMQPWELDVLPEEFVKTFKSADEIWTPSNFSRRAFINSGIEPAKIQVIPNGVNTDIFKPEGEKYKLETDAALKILFVGGTLNRKGIDVLLETYKNTFKQADSVCLIIKDMGSDSFYKGINARDYLNKFCEQDDIPQIIYIDEELSENDMASLYRSASVFVSPYRGEGFSLPTLEAMACGCVPIVTAGGATDDFVEDGVGFRIASEPEDIAEEISGLKLVRKAKWLKPSEKSLKTIFRYIYHAPHVLPVMAANGIAKSHSGWTWKHTAFKILNRIDSIYGIDTSTGYRDKIIEISEKPYSQLDDILSYVNTDYDRDRLIEKAEKLAKSNIKEDIKQTTLNYIAKVIIDDGFPDDAEKILELSDIIGESLDTKFLRLISEQGLEPEVYLERLSEIISRSNDDNIQSLSIGIGQAYLINLGSQILEGMGDIEGAISMMNIAVISEPTDKTLYLRLADLYESLGDTISADKNKKIASTL
jgi:GT2 family glycosyltransferase/glycosyltransferase involved in cell wall biosynthesis/predicted SAM-dependent methyltransferase